MAKKAVCLRIEDQLALLEQSLTVAPRSPVILDYLFPQPKPAPTPEALYCHGCGQQWRTAFGPPPTVCDFCNEAGRITVTKWDAEPPLQIEMRQHGATADGQISLF